MKALEIFKFNLLSIIFFMFCLLPACSVFMPVEAVGGNVYYISPTGSDTNGTGAKSKPWKTLIKAEQNVSAGDTVYCRKGTWTNHGRVNWNVDGTKANPITIAAYPGETPVFSRVGYNNLFIYFDACKWVIVDGLEVEGYQQAFHPQGSPFVDDTSNTITDYAENITIRNCYLHDCISHEIYVSAGCKNIKINSNIIENPTKICMQNWHNPGPVGFEIYNNLFIGGSSGLAVGAGNATNVKIYNNTFYAQKGTAISFFSSLRNVSCKNNIMYHTNPGPMLFSANSSQAALSGMSIDYNLYYKVSGNFGTWGGTKYKTFANWVNNAGKDTNSSNADPLFVKTGSDFHLRSSSPAVDAGISAGPATKDCEGKSRPQGSSYDIGPYERSSSGGVSAPPDDGDCDLKSKFRRTTVQNGMVYYTDRSYSFTNVPSKYIGMEMIKTRNDDKNNTCGSGYMEFTMLKTDKVYVAYDRRATDLPNWMNGFTNTGDRINISQGLQGWMKVYSKQFPGGECVNLGCNKGPGSSGSSINNYIVFYGTSGSTQTGGNCDLDAKFRRTTVQNGMNYYTDRSYSFTNVPSKYIGMEIVKTPNDDKGNTCGSGYLEFTMPKTAKVYVAYDRRATDLPNWMNGFTNTGDRINISQGLQGWLKVYSKQFSGGECVNLGCNKGTGFSGSSINNYIVIVDD